MTQWRGGRDRGRTGRFLGNLIPAEVTTRRNSSSWMRSSCFCGGPTTLRCRPQRWLPRAGRRRNPVSGQSRPVTAATRLELLRDRLASSRSSRLRARRRAAVLARPAEGGPRTRPKVRSSLPQVRLVGGPFSIRVTRAPLVIPPSAVSDWGNGSGEGKVDRRRPGTSRARSGADLQMPGTSASGQIDSMRPRRRRRG